jgi:outer membrane protein assembly factor BamB
MQGKNLWLVFLGIILIGSFFGCNMVGEIEINSTPAGAEVYLDDSLTEFRTNCVLTEIPTGEYTIKVVLAEKEYEEEVKVKNGERVVVDAVLAEEKDLLWKYETGGWIRTCPAINSEGNIYFGSDDGSVYALSPSGNLLWEYPTTGTIRSSPTIGSDGTVYFGSGEGGLYALNSDGSLRWQDTLDSNSLLASPAIGTNGEIYVLENGLYKFTSSGTKTLLVDLVSGGYSSPAIASDATIYFGSNTGVVYAVSSTGELKWSYRVLTSVESSPAIGTDGTIYVANVQVGPTPSYLHAINPDSTEKWRFAVAGSIKSSPAIGTNGDIYVTTDFGYVFAITPEGEQRWLYFAGKGILQASPVIASDGTIYVGTVDSEYNNYFSALDPESGEALWDYKVENYVFHATISPDGVLYFAAGKYFYAIYIGQGLANSPWPKFQHDIRNTGNMSTQ